MLKRVMKRWTSLALALVMVIGLLPAMTLSAAAASLTLPAGLTSSKQSGTWTDITGGIKGTAASTPYKAAEGCGSATQAAAATSTVTVTNTTGKEALLSFDYKATKSSLSDAYVKIDGTAYTGSGSFSKTLANGGTVTIEVYSGKTTKDKDTAKYTSTVELTNISIAVNEDITTTFQPVEGGSYTVDGKAVTGIYSHTKNAQETTVLKATAASGYKFFGWYSVTDGAYLSKDANWTANLTKDQTIKAVFAPTSAPTFQVGAGNEFFDLDEAIDFAKKNNQNLIVLIGDGTLPAGDYTIPSGKTLLIPMDDAHTSYTTTPTNVKSYAAPSAYRTLTMAAGANLTVKGTLSVPSQISAEQSTAGAPRGPGGRIIMNAGSGIILESGANLYCYGFITGGGTVLARNGSKIYECYQIRGFRGGTNTSNMNNGAKNKVFPFNQYYVQNIEVPLTLELGATENVCTAVATSFSTASGGGVLIGSDGLFRIQSGSVTKRYDGSTDRLIIDINGVASVSSMTVSVGVSVNSASFVLPITNNMTINVSNGASLTFTKAQGETALLPGTQVNVNGEMKVENGATLYVYDGDQWNQNFASASAKFVSVASAPGKGEKVTRTAADLVDAVIDVNGTLTVNGALYTTDGGANITTSKGTGKIILGAATGNKAETYQVTQSGTSLTMVSIPITPAKLKNTSAAADAYSQTSGATAGDIFYFHDGMWDKENAPEGEHYPHIPAVDEAVAPTCTETGLTEGSHCGVCGKVLVKQEVVAALGHDFSDSFTVDLEATCTEAGSQSKHCSRCDEKSDVTAIPAKGHTPGEAKQENVVNATCTAEGSYDEVVYCSVCETELSREPKTNEPLGHDWDEGKITTDPTCTDKGVKTFTCKREGCTETRTEEVEDLGHDLTHHDAVTATCNATGKIAYDHCERCGKNFVGKDEVTELTVAIDPNNHVGGTEIRDAKAATCSAEGYTGDTYCLGCNTKTETGKSIEKLPHTWDEGKITTQPTCTTEGVKTFTCTVCEATKTEAVAIDADAHAWGAWKNSGFGHGHHIRVCEHNKEHIDFEDHTWDEGEITTDPTCTDEGVKTFTCTVCEATRTEEVAALGHDTKGSVAHKDASCTEDGVEGGTYCTRCNDGKAAAEAAISKLGHNAEGTVDHKDASCTEDGVVGGTYCTRCNDGKAAAEAKIDATGHTEVTDEAVEPTCTETGLTAGSHCSVCDTVLVAQEVVNAKGHTEVTDAAVAATCTATGLTEGKHCSVCNTVLEEQTVTEKIAHTHGAAVRENEVDSTCTAEGSYDEVVYCAVCKTELSRTGKTIDKKAHTPGEAKEEDRVEAKCEATGSYKLVVRCTECNEVISSEGKTIDATGHAMRETEAQINATCETAGKTAVLTCANDCGKTEGGAEIPATGHDMQETEAQINATCETAGKTAVLTCANGCGKTEGGAEIPATGHAMQETEARIDATCETAGKTAVLTCANGCGKTEGGEMVDALGHNWIAGDITENATCEGAGTQRYTCDRCNETEDRTISATGHEAVTVPGTPATCTTTGTTDGDWCSKCEAWITGHQEIPATGHTEVIDEAQAPTCTETGLTEGKHCSVCNEVLTAQETVEALGHEIVTDEAVEATCTESGLTEGSHCTRCDDATVEQEEIPATGHTEVIDAAVEPTYDAPGKTEGKHCEVCGEVLVPQETLPQLTRPVTPDPGPSTPVTPVTPVPPTPVEPVTPAPVEPTPEEPTETGETEPGEEDLTEVETPLGETPVELGGGLLQLPVIGAGNVVIREDGSIVTKSLVEEQRAYLLLSEPATVRIVSNVKRFIDVKADDWFAPAVDFVSSHELFNGVSDNEFAPDVTMDRAMMVTVLWRLEGCPQVEGTVTFADVAEGEWYTQAVLWAARMGIVKGYDDGNFGTWDKVTREQIAAILYRYMNVMGMNTDAAAKLSAYQDSGAVSDWAQDAMTWAVSRGIITGVTGTLLAPQDDAARCQVATMLQRLVTDMVK